MNVSTQTEKLKIVYEELFSSREGVFLFMNENVYPDPQEITDFLQLIKRDLGKLYCSLVSTSVA